MNALVSGVVVLFCIGTAHAGHMSLATDVDLLRPGLGADAGYLNFLGGAEYTGHTDRFETEDGGHDWADNWITVKHIVLDNLFGTPPSNADVARDMNFSRKVFAQAGIAVRREQTVSRMADDAGPIDGDNINRIVEDEIDVSSPNGDTINVYYWEDLQTRAGDPVLGLTSFAKFDGPPWIFLDSDSDNATHAHELGHMLHNGPAIHQEQPDDENHSNDPTNYIADGRIQDRPVVLTDVGPDNGDTGGTMVIEPSQIQVIHGNPGEDNPGFVKHANHVQTHGDRADFDWVSDQRILETVPEPTHGADLQPGPDYLVWAINPAQVGVSDHEGPASDEHEHAGGELALPGFAGDAMRSGRSTCSATSISMRTTRSPHGIGRWIT